MTTTIFSQIIDGDIPSHKIYEDDKVFAFLDIHPTSQGHTLVVPKNPVEFLWDLPEADYQAVMRASQRIAKHLRTTLKVPYVGEQVVGVDVPHAHVHLIPFTSVDEFRDQPDMTIEPDHAALAALAEKLRLA